MTCLPVCSFDSKSELWLKSFIALRGNKSGVERGKTALKALSLCSEGNQFVCRVTSLWEKHETENLS